MIGQFASKYGIVTAPGAIIDNASATTNVIDTLGYDFLEVTCVIGALDIAVSALKLQESDVKASATALTSGTDITGTVGGTDFTLPIATDDNSLVVFCLSLLGRKRYIDLVATFGDGAAGTYFASTFRLGHGKIDPTASASAAGVLARVVVP